MKKLSILLIFICLTKGAEARPNCNVYKENTPCYEACLEAYKALDYPQGSYESQLHFDRSIELCDFAYSYQQKAIPFLKRGLFVEWKQLIDKAVELAPDQYLGYRGWCRIQFLRDFQGAIDDIEHLKTIMNYDIGYCQTGDYHLEVALALCYKELGQTAKARSLILQKLDTWGPDAYDYYHLGVLEYKEGNYETALVHFQEQLKVNDYMAETYYFIALCYKYLDQPDKLIDYLNTAEEYYRSGKIRVDTYSEPIDKIYLADILNQKSGS